MALRIAMGASAFAIISVYFVFCMMNMHNGFCFVFPSPWYAHDKEELFANGSKMVSK